MPDVDEKVVDFSRRGKPPSDWAKSLNRLARAQALAWDALPIKERLAILQRVDDEQKGRGE